MMLTLEQVKTSLPPGNRNNVTQDVVNQLNALFMASGTVPGYATWQHDRRLAVF